jgi:aspartyl protease family protein
MSFNNLGENDWQNLVYLLLLLSILVPNIIFRKNLPFKTVIKYIGIWSIIGLLVVAAYSYRYEFSDFKNKLLGEINPASARTTESGKLVINLSQDGHFYIDTKINGSSVRFMIDTGASDMVISVETAKRVGLDVENLVFDRIYQTANGKSKGASVVLSKVEIADYEFYDVSASVNNADMGISLLGMSFLKKFQKYEFYRDQLILTK